MVFVVKSLIRMCAASTRLTVYRHVPSLVSQPQAAETVSISFSLDGIPSLHWNGGPPIDPSNSATIDEEPIVHRRQKLMPSPRRNQSTVPPPDSLMKQRTQPGITTQDHPAGRIDPDERGRTARVLHYHNACIFHDRLYAPCSSPFTSLTKPLSPLAADAFGQLIASAVSLFDRAPPRRPARA